MSGNKNQEKGKIAEAVLRFGSYHYVIFYKEEMLIITLSDSFMNNTSYEMKTKWKSEGIGFFKRLDKMSVYWNHFCDTLLYMTRAQIKDIQNFSETFEYKEISEYIMTEANSKFHEDYISSRMGKFSIEDKSGKYCHINHSYKSYSYDYRNMVIEMKKRVVNAIAKVS